jgi:hypothetical protein
VFVGYGLKPLTRCLLKYGFVVAGAAGDPYVRRLPHAALRGVRGHQRAISPRSTATLRRVKRQRCADLSRSGEAPPKAALQYIPQQVGRERGNRAGKVSDERDVRLWEAVLALCAGLNWTGCRRRCSEMEGGS